MLRNAVMKGQPDATPLTWQETQKFVVAITELFSVKERQHINTLFAKNGEIHYAKQQLWKDGNGSS